MRFSAPIYLHFLDRELCASVGQTFSFAEAQLYIKTMLLGTDSILYAGISLAWESPSLEASSPGVEAMIVDLIATNCFEIVSQYGTPDEFLESRRLLYAHDRDRYPMYFGGAENRPLAKLRAQRLKRTSATQTLEKGLMDWALSDLSPASGDPEREAFAKRGVKTALIAREGRAVTFSLFREGLSEDRSNDALTHGIVRREISSGYTKHYLDSFGGDLATGIRGLDYYEPLARNFPEVDICVLTALMTALGFKSALEAPWSERAPFWRHWTANRGHGAAYQELALQTRCIIRALHTASTSAGETSRAVIRHRLVEWCNRASSQLPELRGEERLDVLHGLQQCKAVVAFLCRQRAFAEAYHRTLTEEEGSVTLVLIATATEIERDTVLQVAREITGREADFDYGSRRTYFKLGTIGGARVVMVQSEMGSGGPGASQATLGDAIDELNPTSVLMVGIAFGVDPDRQVIGQILVSRQMHAYELARVGTTKDGKRTIIPRGDKVTASTRILSRLRAAQASWKGADVEFTLLLSGEKLVDNLDYREEIRRLQIEARGGEMEGAGLYAAAADRQTEWCIVKAVCDWADGRKRTNKTRRQKRAAEQAARFVLSAIQSGGFGPPTLGT